MVGAWRTCPADRASGRVGSLCLMLDSYSTYPNYITTSPIAVPVPTHSRHSTTQHDVWAVTVSKGRFSHPARHHVAEIRFQGKPATPPPHYLLCIAGQSPLCHHGTSSHPRNRQPSSRPRAASTRSNMPSRPSPTPELRSASSPRMASYSPPRGK